MRELFLKTLKKYNLVEKGDGIVLGVSGGPDSMCMLHLFCSIREEWDLSLYAVHLNHEFRGQAADEDATYVDKICREWSIPLFVYSSNVEELAKEWKTSFEDAGRRERYRVFFKVLDSQKADRIAVAQNKNDQAETILMRLIRGSGLEGLTGIDYKRPDGVIRPILGLKRKDVEEYCRDNGIEPRIDHTNDDVTYTRNKIRKELLSKMAQMNPLVVEHIAKAGQLLRHDNELLEELTTQAFGDVVCIQQSKLLVELASFNAFKIGLKRRVIRRCIGAIRGHLTDVTYDEIETIIQLAQKSKTGSRKLYHGDLNFEISYDKMFIYLGKKENKTSNDSLEVREMTREEFEDYHLLPDEIAVDKDKLTGQLEIKRRNAGDKFSPIGLNGHKKLKDFFIDEKVPRDVRDAIPIVWDQKGIVWIVGYRQDCRYVVDDNTSNILILQCMKLLT